MPKKRISPNFMHQFVLVLIILGLIIGTALPVRGDENDSSWSLSDVIRTIEPSVVWVIADMGMGQWSQGSGIIVREDGYILTNAHVVIGANDIVVGWPDRFNRSEQLAEIIALDIDADLALIRIPGVHLPTVPFDITGSASLGDAVITLGYPVGEELGLGGLTVTQGILSCIRRDADGEVVLLQTDAAVTLGCSGGPLYDLDTGSVIGVVQGKGMLLLEGFNFAIPSQRVSEFAGTEVEDGIDGAIDALSRSYDAGLSMPCERALDIFDAAIRARDQDEWGEALSNFLAASRLDEEDPSAAFGVAESYAALVRPDQALQWLERAFELGFTDFEGALDADGFEEFRDDDRFVELVQSF